MNIHQEHLLDLLREVDAFCREHDITYYCAGGTVIGAARHHGFIPWDDDIDIYMTRENFARFAELLPKCGPAGRKLEYYEGNHERQAAVARYHKDDDTMFCHFNLIGRSSAGTSIDVFILDPIPNDYEGRVDYLAMLYAYSDLISPCHVYSHRLPTSKYGIYEKYKKIADEEGRPRAAELIADEIFHYDAKECRDYTLRWGSISLVYPVEVIGEPVYLPFEDMMIPVPHDWYRYLVIHFGTDWYNLPYEETQHEHYNIVRYDMKYNWFYEKRDALYTQDYLLDLHFKWKDAERDFFRAAEPIEQYVLGVQNAICRANINKNAAAPAEKTVKTVEELFAAGRYRDILRIYQPYISMQTSPAFMGRHVRHGQQFRWNFPHIMPLKDSELRCLLLSMIYTGGQRTAERLLGVFERADMTSPAISETSDLIDLINLGNKLYYQGQYEECLAAIDSFSSSADSAEHVADAATYAESAGTDGRQNNIYRIPALRDLYYLCKVRIEGSGKANAEDGRGVQTEGSDPQDAFAAELELLATGANRIFGETGISTDRIFGEAGSDPDRNQSTRPDGNKNAAAPSAAGSASQPDAASEAIRKAWGDLLWARGHKEEAEAVYRGLMKSCRNGLFWMDIQTKVPDIAPIPTKRLTPFTDTELTRKQRQLLEEIDSICRENGIKYVIGSDLARRMHLTGNIGYANSNREVFMDAGGAAKFISAFERKYGSGAEKNLTASRTAAERNKNAGMDGAVQLPARKLLSWKNGDAVRDFALIYSGTENVYCDFRRLGQWRDMGIFITIRILRDSGASKAHKRRALMDEFFLNLTNIEGIDRRNLQSLPKKLLGFAAGLKTEKGRERLSAKVFDRSMRAETAANTGRAAASGFYYYTNIRGMKPARHKFARSLWEDTAEVEVNGVSYAIPKAMTAKYVPHETDLANVPPVDSIFIYRSDEMSWSEISPLIDDAAYEALDWDGYAKARRKFRKLDQKVWHAWWMVLKLGEELDINEAAAETVAAYNKSAAADVMSGVDAVVKKYAALDVPIDLDPKLAECYADYLRRSGQTEFLKRLSEIPSA